MTAPSTKKSLLQVFVALAIVYLVWGSTYLAIRFGVGHAPPFLFAALRFVLAGGILLAWASWRGEAWPSRKDLLTATVTGVLMLVGGNGLVTWAEQWIASNEAALIVATSALWIAGFGAIGPQKDSVGRLTVAGLVLGFVGVALLVNAGLHQRHAPTVAYLAMVASPLCWALGSVLARRRPTTCGVAMASAMQMLIASVVLAAIGLARHEPLPMQWDARAWAPLAYLVVFGSCIAYSAYVWLVHQVTPAVLGTYAYVNPAVAVLLGWLLADEVLGATQWAGTLVILLGVLMVSVAQVQSRKEARA